MKGIKLNKVYFLTLFFSILLSVIISVFLSTRFSMRYMSHLYNIGLVNANSVMHINKRIDLIDKKINDRHKKEVKPVSL